MRNTVLAPLLLVALLSACATPDHKRVDALAGTLGFERTLMQGDAFAHVIYVNDAPADNGTLHVYLEGDGTPWIRQIWIASDPTPENPLMLGLMAMDNSASVYLGRPCYHGLAGSPPCEASFWTGARYSEQVVASMETALRQVMEGGSFSHLALFGHSGGGALAMLLAERFPQTTVVVTLAGNLDIDGWTRLHGYMPLRKSLNPATRQPLPGRIFQLHLAGAKDRNVPPDLLTPVIDRQNQAQLRVLDGYDHACCWQDLWPEILRTVSTRTKISARKKP